MSAYFEVTARVRVRQAVDARVAEEWVRTLLAADTWEVEVEHVTATRGTGENCPTCGAHSQSVAVEMITAQYAEIKRLREEYDSLCDLLAGVAGVSAGDTEDIARDLRVRHGDDAVVRFRRVVRGERSRDLMEEV